MELIAFCIAKILWCVFIIRRSFVSKLAFRVLVELFSIPSVFSAQCSLCALFQCVLRVFVRYCVIWLYIKTDMWDCTGPIYYVQYHLERLLPLLVKLLRLTIQSWFQMLPGANDLDQSISLLRPQSHVDNSSVDANFFYPGRCHFDIPQYSANRANFAYALFAKRKSGIGWALHSSM